MDALIIHSETFIFDIFFLTGWISIKKFFYEL